MYYKYIEEFLTKEECEAIIEFGDSHELQRLTAVKKNPDGTFQAWKPCEDKLHRRSGTYFRPSVIESNKLINNVQKKTIDLLNKELPFKNTTFTHIRTLTFNKYVEGDFLNTHQDLHELNDGASITVLYQLNDDYEGGHVTYVDNDEKTRIVKKKQGSVFLFDPSIFHSVQTITKGVRFSMNSWPSIKQTKSLL